MHIAGGISVPVDVASRGTMDRDAEGGDADGFDR